MFITIILIVVVFIVIWLVKTYNRLQTSMQDIREMFSNLQAGLKKRQQLSGQIIEIASGYMAHEQLTQLKVAQSSAGEMRVLAQAFPQLKADATYQKLMNQLESLENDILARREKYNYHVKAYNSYRNAFPVILVAQKLSTPSTTSTPTTKNSICRRRASRATTPRHCSSLSARAPKPSAAWPRRR